jgi:hypothetical protein
LLISHIHLLDPGYDSELFSKKHGIQAVSRSPEGNLPACLTSLWLQGEKPPNDQIVDFDASCLSLG